MLTFTFFGLGLIDSASLKLSAPTECSACLQLELSSMLLLQVVCNLWGHPSIRYIRGLLCDGGPGGHLEEII